MDQTATQYWIARIQDHFIGTFTFDLGRYLIAASALTLILWLARSWADARRIQNRRAKPNDYVREISSSFRTVFFFALTGMATVLMIEGGIIPVHQGSYDLSTLCPAGRGDHAVPRHLFLLDAPRAAPQATVPRDTSSPPQIAHAHRMGRLQLLRLGRHRRKRIHAALLADRLADGRGLYRLCDLHLPRLDDHPQCHGSTRASSYTLRAGSTASGSTG